MGLIKNKQEVLNNFPTCYACDDARTSMEHAPPRCFFPEEKDDAGTYLFRRNLIKVPSCDKHNSEKSGDDTYALWHIASLDGVNKCGEMMHQKLHRMARHDFEKRGGALLKRMTGEVIGFDEDDRVLAKLDGARMQQFLCLVARAVYFSETFTKLLVPLRVTNISNDFRDPAHTAELRKHEEFFDSEMAGSPVLGANPDAFQYSITNKADGTILVRLVFYGSLKHWIFYTPIP